MYTKKKLTTSFFVLFAFLVIQAQKVEGTLFFKDGTTKSGLVRLASKFSVKYWPDKNAKKQEYHFDQLDRVEIAQEEGVLTYQAISLNKNKQILVHPMELGRVNLYYRNSMSAGPTYGGGMTGPDGNLQSNQEIYVKRKGEDFATRLGSDDMFGTSFKQSAEAYFGDCSVLKMKISENEFKKKDIQQIVAIYNNDCQ